ncbi:MAG TPA: AAA family ATPase [Geobacteraceae bacterium]|nr:AAA family ATPase [Geobacteraceae bacterium]
MYSPYRFASRIGNIGQKLPDPYRSLARQGVYFRRGNVAMAAGPPGSFKSIWALNVVSEWSGQGITTLYFSADGDEFTVVRRLSGILTGDNADLVESRMVSHDVDRYEKILSGLRVEFEYEQFDFEDIVIHVKSYEAVYGAYPDVIVLDNLIDFVSSPFAFDEMLVLIKHLDGLAKEIKSHVLLLHHSRLPDIRPNERKPRPMGQPPADHEISGKVTQIPALVLTMAAAALNLNIACVKNRNGKQYRDASHYEQFSVSQNMRIREDYKHDVSVT